MAEIEEKTGADPAPAPLAAMVGKRVAGRYRLESVIGAGAGGVVFRGADEESGGPVAVKFLGDPFGVADRARSRFDREGKALMRLRHSGIVELRDYGLFESKPYLVMELLEGETLSARIRRQGQLPVPEAISVVKQILSALAAAHARGMIHRDLKPANVFVVGDTVKLLDFGLVKFVGTESSSLDQTLTQTGMVVGTPLYMAPEQGTGDRVDKRADVYAAGCVLFELLAGFAPFRRDTTTETIRAHLLSPVPELPEIATSPATRSGLEEVILRSLAKAPGDRYEDAVAMLDALGSLERTGRARLSAALWQRRRPWLSGLLLVGLLAGGWGVFGDRLGEARRALADRDPWASDVPLELRGVRTAILAGTQLNEKQAGDLRAYRRLYPDDPRPVLLLAHDYANRNWYRDALSRYDQALSLSLGARRDPKVLENLIEISTSLSNSDAAQALLAKHYGSEALPALRKAAASARGNRAKRLAEAIERIAKAGEE